MTTRCSGLGARLAGLIIGAQLWSAGILAAQTALPPHVRVDLLTNRVVEALQRENPALALVFIDSLKAVTAVPFPTPLLWVEAIASHAVGRYVRANEALQRFVSQADRGSPEYQRAIALVPEYERVGMAQLDSILGRGIQRAQALLRAGEFEQALRELNPIIVNPRYNQFPIHLAEARRLIAEYQPGIDAFQRRSALEIRSYSELIAEAKAERDTTRQVEIWGIAARRFPDSTEAHKLLRDISVVKHDFESALRHAREASLAADRSKDYSNRGYTRSAHVCILLSLDRNAEAVKIMDEWDAIHPFRNFWYERALTMVRAGQRDQALAHLEQNVRLARDREDKADEKDGKAIIKAIREGKQLGLTGFCLRFLRTGGW